MLCLGLMHPGHCLDHSLTVLWVNGVEESEPEEVLEGNPPKTRLITNARSSLQGGSVLVWLLGDRRTIRGDARIYFRRANLPEDAEVEPNGNWKDNELKYRDSFFEIDVDEADYARMLEVINELLPVRELAGRL